MCNKKEWQADQRLLQALIRGRKKLMMGDREFLVLG